MRILIHASKTFADDLAAFCRGTVVPKEIADSVAAILADVRGRGDEAVAYYAAKFDGAKLRAQACLPRRDGMVGRGHGRTVVRRIGAGRRRAFARGWWVRA